MASMNISTGPISQFCTSDSPSTRLVAEDLVQFFVAHPRERRIHHEDQPRRDRNRSRADAEAVQERHDSGSKPAQRHAQQPSRRRSIPSDSDPETTSGSFSLLSPRTRPIWSISRLIARCSPASPAAARGTDRFAVKNGERIAERTGDLLRRSLDCGGIRNAPVRRHRLPRPVTDTAPWPRCRRP